MENKPKISVLIITYNRTEDTLALLQSLKSQTELTLYVGEILLLNNASTISYEPIEKFIADNQDLPIHYFPHDENLGVARGRNFLIKKAKFPYLLVLDDDIEFADKEGVKTISQLFEKEQYKENNTAVITLDIFYFENKKRQLSAFPHKNHQKYIGKDWFLTATFIGAAHLMKKELFEKTGYYPEDFFYGMEEYDLSYRIIQEGYTLAYDNSVKIYHKESPLGRVPNKDKIAMMWYNKCVVAWRYLPNKFFYSTAFMWSLEYLRKSKFDVMGMLKNLGKIRNIPKEKETHKIDQKALDYLRKVEARLKY